MILGGCGVRLEELVGLYASLANAGEFHELRYVNTDSIPFSFQWMKREAAFLVSEILTGVTRPDLPSNWQMGASVPHIAWKTGTSYGRRDAWSIGYNAEYTIGVWVGNFNNEGVPGLNGADMATPLLFRLFETLQPRSSQHWLYPPEGLAMREICSETGQVPGPYCINKSSDYFLPGISRSPTCTCREKLWVNLREHTLYCRSCAPKTGIKEHVLRIYPPELSRYFEEKNIHYARLPVHQVNCPRIFQEEGPRIVSPTDKAEY